MQIATRHPDIDTAHPDDALHPRLIQRVRDGDFAELDEAVRLQAGLFDTREGARRVTLMVPVLADRHGFSRTRTDNRPAEPAALTEHLRVAGALYDRFRGVCGVRNLDARRPLLRVLVRPIAPERTLHVVGHD